MNLTSVADLADRRAKADVRRRPDLPARVEDIPTPSLIVDLDQLEANLDLMRTRCANGRIHLRPHMKAHKCPAIAQMQVARGAHGVCCQTVGEVETMAEAGMTDILLTNQIVEASKLDRLTALMPTTRVTICVDHPEHIRLAAQACSKAGVRMDVMVEVDVGGARCGVTSLVEATDLATLIVDCQPLRFAGLQAYDGRAQHVRGVAERRAAAYATAKATRRIVRALSQRGIDCPSISGGGTGTFAFDMTADGLTEIQPGSYALMDLDYARNEQLPGVSFQHALHVIATAISRPEPGRVVIDAGLKAVAFDSGPPVIANRLDTSYWGASDEHGVLVANDANLLPLLGEKVRLIPGHCDPTVNLHDRLFGIRGGMVEMILPIAARGYSSPHPQ